MTQPRTLKTVTLGCKVNQYETEIVRRGSSGWDIASRAKASRSVCALSTPVP